MKLLLIFLSLNCFAQTVHVHKLDPKLSLPKIEGTQVHEAPASLVKAQADFQSKVFTRANVVAKTSTLNFEEKESLLETLEEVDQAAFLKRYPQFTPAEASRLKAALYE